MTPEQLAALASEHGESERRYAYRLHVCAAAGCRSSGAGELASALENGIKQRGMDDTVMVRRTGCMGLCAAGPMLIVHPGAVHYGHVREEHAEAILDSLGGDPVQELLLDAGMPFFQAQQKVVLENAGLIDPESLGDYVVARGYEGLARAVAEMTPHEVIGEITASGLRGRGGAGYPTGLKWSLVGKADAENKYVVCNADEGDPGAFMDRSVLESDPHRVIEGMAIAAYAVGASHGYVYLRAEYPLAIERLEKALRQARKTGMIGNGIFETDFDFDIEIRLGAGAFVCGEETALMASIEGKRGQPRPRPPYPANFGLWGCPTLINNVETLANVPTILRNGGAWFAGIGTANSKGTKVFALAGRVLNTGLIEVPMGITLKEIIYDVGGGIPDGKEFKALQTGGPSGGCIPSEFLEMPVDYESLSEVGSIMGSGGMIVMDTSSCMVDVAKYFMDFCRTESCGKCIPCRTGTPQMYGILSRITDGSAGMHDLELLRDLCDVVENTSLCGLGQTAANPVKSTLKFFEDEYIAHIQHKKCPAGVCKIQGGK